MSSQKLSISFSGQTLKWFRADEPETESFTDADDAEGFGVASLRCNQSLSDAMNAESADVGKLLSDYIARKTKQTGVNRDLLDKIK